MVKKLKFNLVLLSFDYVVKLVFVASLWRSSSGCLSVEEWLPAPVVNIPQVTTD